MLILSRQRCRYSAHVCVGLIGHSLLYCVIGWGKFSFWSRMCQALASGAVLQLEICVHLVVAWFTCCPPYQSLADAASICESRLDHADVTILQSQMSSTTHFALLYEQGQVLHVHLHSKEAWQDIFGEHGHTRESHTSWKALSISCTCKCATSAEGTPRLGSLLSTYGELYTLAINPFFPVSTTQGPFLVVSPVRSVFA